MLSEAAKALLAIVPRGQANAVHRKILANRLTLDGHDASDRAVSALTDELIQAGYPVASSRGAARSTRSTSSGSNSGSGPEHSSGGVFLCETEEEKRAYGKMLEHTIIALAKRLRAFDRAAHERLVAQGVFGFVRRAG